ncbi:MAG: ribose 5-phosphate isomerase B [Saprospiraceae bacterium]|nr:ribose 5-phosphate isomerase B [Saprospiraceae bacterium]MDP4819470.1 ribose 5-phosphate isomerase B [Saprospiraceae bacterium]MDP4999929.1 ribose 5-phosphate isomerase B [Saprospiraceae bacterium]
MGVNKIAIGCDHAGFPYRLPIIAYLQEQGIEVVDHGAFSADSVDYPDFAHRVAEDVAAGKVDLGIVLCGSGNGVAMTVNKHQDIRGALCWIPEIATLARQHNDANVLALPVRFIEESVALAIVSAFLEASFEGGRHQTRVNKIGCS